MFYFYLSPLTREREVIRMYFNAFWTVLIVPGKRNQNASKSKAYLSIWVEAPPFNQLVMKWKSHYTPIL